MGRATSERLDELLLDHELASQRPRGSGKSMDLDAENVEDREEELMGMVEEEILAPEPR